MNTRISGLLAAIACTAAFAIVTGPLSAAAQSNTPSAPGANSPPAPTAQTSRGSGDQQVTVTGCIQREADYRRAAGAGSGGVAGSGVGTANEFVLANAMMSTGSPSTSASSSNPSPSTATGTAGTRGTAYELTGSGEGQVASLVGKHVEISGKLKAGDAAGGPTANVPGSRDLKLRELEVSTVRETPGTCSPSAP